MTRQITFALVFGLAASTAAAQASQQRAMRFAGMDTNNDGVVTRAEWEGSTRAFEIEDWNGDGILSGEEVRPGAKRRARGADSRAPEPAYRPAAYDDWTASGFTALDLNRDGRISRDEWRFDIATFQRVDGDRDDALSRAEFTGEREEASGRNNRLPYLDSNKDGRVSRAEWRGTAERFDALDANRDGQLTRQELRAPAATPQSEAWRQGQARGLVEGRQAGKEDRERNQGWDLDGQRELETADSGYEARFGPRADYQTGYREAFRRGYREGWGAK